MVRQAIQNRQKYQTLFSLRLKVLSAKTFVFQGVQQKALAIRSILLQESELKRSVILTFLISNVSEVSWTVIKIKKMSRRTNETSLNTKIPIEDI
jgi:hypothetical protein